MLADLQPRLAPPHSPPHVGGGSILTKAAHVALACAGRVLLAARGGAAAPSPLVEGVLLKGDPCLQFDELSFQRLFLQCISTGFHPWLRDAVDTPCRLGGSIPAADTRCQ